MTDQQLIQRYAKHRDQSAFAELVARHAGWIHAMAQRLVRDPAMADDITQTVFVLLARKASSLGKTVALSGWLFVVTRYTAHNALRLERRRVTHERRAATMRQQIDSPHETSWIELAPVLDEKVATLRSSDRQAVLLRFYECRSFAEIGQTLSISEEAARKRVSRAVEQLRGRFTEAGVGVGAATLGVALTANLTNNASAQVVAAASATGGASSATVGSLVKTTAATLAFSALKPIVALAAALLVVGSVIGAVLQVTQRPSPPAIAAALPSTAPSTRSALAEGFFGRVMTPDGAPAAGAKVIRVQSGKEDPSITETTVTDANGAFHLGSRDYSFGILIQASGFALTNGDLSDEYDANDPQDFVLRPSTKLIARLVGPDLKPVAGVHVEPTIVMGNGTYPGIPLPKEIRKQFSSSTDAEGHFEIRDLPQEKRVRLDIDDDRFASMQNDLVLLSNQPNSDVGDLNLKAAASVSGRLVIAGSNRPVAGVRVAAQGTDVGGGGWAETISQADGSFQLIRMAPGQYNIAAFLSEELSAKYAAAAIEGLQIDAGVQITGKQITFDTGALIKGKLFVEDTNRPLEGIPIGVHGPAHPRSGPGVQSVLTRADGTFEIRVPAGKQYVYVAQELSSGLSARPQPQNIEVSADKPAEVNFIYHTASVQHLQGRTIDSNGAPLPHARILVESPGPDVPFRAGLGNSQAKSDDNGNFTLEGVDRGSILRARRGHWSTLVPLKIAGDETITLTLQKNAAQTLVVRVEDINGNAIRGAKVRLSQMGITFGTGVDDKTTGEEGTCVLSMLYPDMNYFVDADAKGFGHAQQRLHLTAGQRPDVLLMILPMATSFVEGRVVDSQQQPVEGAEVSISGKFTAPQSTKTDKNGRFRFDSVVDGEKVYVRTPASTQPFAPVLAGSDDLVIVTQPK